MENFNNLFNLFSSLQPERQSIHLSSDNKFHSSHRLHHEAWLKAGVHFVAALADEDEAGVRAAYQPGPWCKGRLGEVGKAVAFLQNQRISVDRPRRHVNSKSLFFFVQTHDSSVMRVDILVLNNISQFVSPRVHIC